MLENLRHDLRRLAEFKLGKPRASLKLTLESLLFDNGFQAVVLHRCAHFFKKRGIPVIGPVIGRLSQLVTGVEISPSASVGPGLLIGHGQGIVVGKWASIGSDCTMMQQVTLGATQIATLEGMPTLGDGVFLGAGARVLGPVRIGHGALVGANALVAEDVPDGGKALAAPAIVRGPRPDSGEPASGEPASG
ncbi:MAG: serine O-acetyltransferase [Acidobacteriota bacterium]